MPRSTTEMNTDLNNDKGFVSKRNGRKTTHVRDLGANSTKLAHTPRCAERQYNSFNILAGSRRPLCNVRGVLDPSTADGRKMKFNWTQIWGGNSPSVVAKSRLEYYGVLNLRLELHSTDALTCREWNGVARSSISMISRYSSFLRGDPFETLLRATTENRGKLGKGGNSQTCKDLWSESHEYSFRRTPSTWGGTFKRRERYLVPVVFLLFSDR